MISINLYKAGSVDETIDFPSTWNDLHPKELLTISRVMLSDLQAELVAKSITLLEMLKYRASLKRISVETVQKIDPEDLSLQLAPLTQFLYEKIELTRQPYPVLKLNYFKTMHGPASDFEKLTAGEFEAAEIPFLQFADNPDPALLAAMAAILYRPKGREFLAYNAVTNSYIPYDHERMIKHFEKLEVTVLFTIYMWYQGCRNTLPLLFPTIHEGEGNGKPDLLVFTKCIHSAAGEKNGTRDQVRRTLLKELFFEMEQEAIKAKEIKAQQDANNK